MSRIGTYSGRNPFLWLGRNVLIKQFYGHTDLRALQHLSFSFDSPVTEYYNTEQTIQKLGIFYMHVWLLARAL